VFGVENLFVASSSVFPTGGHSNCTLTIMALALRLAEHLGIPPHGPGKELSVDGLSVTASAIAAPNWRANC
jgi:choline dehydrogenase-like flavoprotein